MRLSARHWTWTLLLLRCDVSHLLMFPLNIFAGFRGGQHQRREWRRGGSGIGRDGQTGDGLPGRHPEDESAQVRQGGRHGRVDVLE